MSAAEIRLGAAEMATPLEPAHAWLAAQGWALSDYSITKSAVQSCPQGMVTLDCVCVAESASEDERASRSRVLEVDQESGAIEAVLAGRDNEQLERILRSGAGDTALAMPPAATAPVPSGEECKTTDEDRLKSTMQPEFFGKLPDETVVGIGKTRQAISPPPVICSY